MKIIAKAILVTLAILLASCEEESLYSGYHARFIFDGNVHPYNQARSFGQFIGVRKGNNIGQYKLTDAQGNTQTVNIPQIHLQQGAFHYGLGGLLIGTPSTYGDDNLIAYDWACPSCDIARHRVEIDYTMWHATCPNCHAKFDLNSGGIPIEGQSRPLRQYHVFDSGIEVIVQN